MGRGSMVEASSSASKRELRSTYDDLGRAMCEAELNFAADAYVKRLNGDPLKYEPLVDESGGGSGSAPLPKPNGCAPRRLFAPLMRSWWLLLEAQRVRSCTCQGHATVVVLHVQGNVGPNYRKRPSPELFPVGACSVIQKLAGRVVGHRNPTDGPALNCYGLQRHRAVFKFWHQVIPCLAPVVRSQMCYLLCPSR